MGFLYCYLFIVTYLLFYDDIESYPGPELYIVCSSCKGQVHVQKSVCTCGSIFKNKTRYGDYKKLSKTSRQSAYNSVDTYWVSSYGK